VAIDPNPFNWPKLHKSAVLNNLTDRITLLPYAVFSDYRNVSMSQAARNLGHTYLETQKDPKGKKEDIVSTVDEPSVARFTAMTIKLDDVSAFVHTRNVVIKIDVESYECFVVRGGHTFLETHDGNSNAHIISAIFLQ
jgi:FkbM family methyltransferase